MAVHIRRRTRVCVYDGYGEFLGVYSKGTPSTSLPVVGSLRSGEELRDVVGYDVFSSPTSANWVMTESEAVIEAARVASRSPK